MTCYKCGNIIQDGLSICPVCGASLITQNNTSDAKGEKNIIDNNVVATNKKHRFLIGLIVIIIVIILVTILIFSGLINFNNNKVTTGGNVKTVNGENTKTRSTTGKKTTEKMEDSKESKNSKEHVQINDLSFTVPLGFEFGSQESDENRKYYLLRKNSDAVISFDVLPILSNLDITFEEEVSNYGENKDITIDREKHLIKNYEYYRIIHKEIINQKQFKNHLEIIMSLSNNYYINAYILDYENFGEQNYLQVLTNFIDSSK